MPMEDLPLEIGRPIHIPLGFRHANRDWALRHLSGLGHHDFCVASFFMKSGEREFVRRDRVGNSDGTEGDYSEGEN